jgi:hypothetical protein
VPREGEKNGRACAIGFMNPANGIQPSAMNEHIVAKGRIRRFVDMLLAALLLGAAEAAVAHGAFESMMTVFWIGLTSTFLLLTIGALLRPWRRTRILGGLIVVSGVIACLAIPAAFVAARGVVAIDMWRAKRYIAAELGPNLEQVRRSTGRYPSELRLHERRPANAPWLLDGFSYASDGRAYTLSVMDPGVCGHVTSYASATGQWTETYHECWY